MFHFIVNPSARSGRSRQLWGELRALADERGIAYTEHLTKGPGDAIRITKDLLEKQEDGADRLKLVVLGGDGTLNEAISGIEDFSRVLLGYIPTGSSNDFARGLKLPKDPRALFDRILDGRELRAIDVGRLTYNHQTKTLSRLHDKNASDHRHFLVSAGIGFDAAVCEEALASGTKNFLNRIGLGKLTYGAIALRELLRADRIPVTVELDGGQVISLDHFLFVAMMQQPYEGGGFRFAPDANDHDGLFDICLIGDMSKPMMLYALPFGYFGKHYRFNGTYHYTSKDVRIRTELPLWVHTDGEVMMKSDDISLTCLPRALAMMI